VNAFKSKNTSFQFFCIVLRSFLFVNTFICEFFSAVKAAAAAKAESEAGEKTPVEKEEQPEVRDSKKPSFGAKLIKWLGSFTDEE
jgi:hypothetical protein